MLLFLIGMELRPTRLWTMRRSVLGLGAAQVVVTTAALAAAAHFAGLAWPVASVVGFGLSLSSTALVLPMLAERDLLTTHAGRDSFAVLLFQDIAVIPAVALIPLFHGDTTIGTNGVLMAVAKGARRCRHADRRALSGSADIPPRRSANAEIFTARPCSFAKLCGAGERRGPLDSAPSS
jgi:hypothetical protein